MRKHSKRSKCSEFRKQIILARRGPTRYQLYSFSFQMPKFPLSAGIIGSDQVKVNSDTFLFHFLITNSVSPLIPLKRFDENNSSARFEVELFTETSGNCDLVFIVIVFSSNMMS